MSRRRKSGEIGEREVEGEGEERERKETIIGRNEKSRIEEKGMEINRGCIIKAWKR